MADADDNDAAADTNLYQKYFGKVLSQCFLCFN